ncbi:MAG: bifunctional DNA-binding transcriptional regulator/O6-methylguanine-DNA methyltransferase Ada [Deltaproteobacteria bacterium]|nr:bifunctional DNA-binding transcriptional regulator/O6-methylguanine-DNA methyltransferase Ada [Deltaproteobacteria bacterium]
MHGQPGPTEDERRWNSVVSRDRSADGRFFFAVQTTGVYCRPSCASRLARRENVSFFETTEDAERAGYRPCKRCRPDQSSANVDAVALMLKACRFIEASEETPPLAQLATLVGLSPEYFQKTFRKLIGVSPKEYAIALRSEKVRQELATAESVTSAMYSAGFNSSGRFYDNAEKILGMTPTAYRAGGRGMNITVTVSTSWIGTVLVATTARGVCSVLLGDDARSVLTDIRSRFPLATFRDADSNSEQLVSAVIASIADPFTHSTVPLDVQGTAFQHLVWNALRQIPPGETRSYAQLAASIGRPASTRAVATACAANPAAVIVPCHRVVRADGSLSGYRWGVERKEQLLAREREQSETVDQIRSRGVVR